MSNFSLSDRLAVSDLRARALEAHGGNDIGRKHWEKASESFCRDVLDILAVTVEPARVGRLDDGSPWALVDGLTIQRYGLAGLQITVACERCLAPVRRVFTTLSGLGAHLAEPGLCIPCEMAETHERRAAQGWGLT